MLKEETRRVAKDALEAAGNLHWIAVGFSVLAFVLERMSKVSSNHKESIKLLDNMTCLAKRLQDLNDRIPKETESINRGVQTIVEGATTCCCYILKGRAYGWAVAGTMESTLADIRTDIDRVYRDVDYILGMKIVREVGRRSVPDPKKLLDIPPLGVDDQVKAARELLDVEGNTPALAVIIYGFGGAGKTTLGKAVVESLNLSGYGFATVTMEEQSNICGLQKDIIYALTKEAIEFNSHDLGQTELSKVFKKQPSFIFIDNVVNEQDIRRLLPKNLSEGNQKLRILMTSRRSIVKREFSISCKEHQINTLSAEISKEILRKTIVQSHGIPDPEIQKISDLIDSVAVACGGIPLLLEVYGKYLRNNTDPEEYEAALGSLKKGPKPGLYIEEDLSEILLYVYEKLDEDTKEAFLDICTFFHGRKRDLVSSLVGKIHLKRLEEAALAKTDTSERVIVHDVLKAMGVKKAEDTRLKALRDLERVLRNENKLKNVKGMWLEWIESTLTLQSQKIDAMEDSLRVLVLGDRIKVHGQCHGTFSKLRFLQIGDMYSFPFPLGDTPTLDGLIVLNDRSMGSLGWTELPPRLKHIWLRSPEDDMFAMPPPIVRWRNIKDLRDLQTFHFLDFEGIAYFPEQFVLPTSLKELRLNGCKDLVSLPNGFGRLIHLEKLILDECNSLTALPESFGNLNSLEFLSMTECKNLTKLTENFGQLSSLKNLNLSGCLNLKELPPQFGQLSSLKDLNLSGCLNLRELPPQFGQLSSLKNLDLSGCLNLKELPSDLGRIAASLKEIDISECESLERLPEGFGKLSLLQSLNLEGLKSLIELPANIGTHMSSLIYLQLVGCHSLTSLPCSFGNLSSLKELQIRDCPKLSALPTEIAQLPSLKIVALTRCGSIRKLPEGFGHLPLLELRINSCRSLVTLPEGFGQLQYLKYIGLRNCVKLVRLPVDFEGLSSLRCLDLTGCKLLEGETMTTVAKLESLCEVTISGCDKLIEQWAQMRKEKEYPIIVHHGGEDSLAKSAAIVAAAGARLLMDAQCRLVDRNGKFILSSNFIDVGATVALISEDIFPPPPEMQKFLVKLCSKLSPVNTHIISFRGKKIRTDAHHSDEETPQNPAVIQHLPGIKCHAIHSSDIKSRMLLTSVIRYGRTSGRDFKYCSVIVMDVVNKEGRKCFVEREEFWSGFGGKSEEENGEEDTAEASCPSSQSSSSGNWNTTGQFTKLLEKNGIGYLMTNTGTEVAVGDLQGKLGAVSVCSHYGFNLFSLVKMYTDLQRINPNFQMVWVPGESDHEFSSGSYERARAYMPWLTLPDPTLFKAGDTSDCIILSEEEAMIEGEDMELVLRWGADAYPFTEAKMEELKSKELSDMQQQSSLEFILGGRSCLDSSGNMVNRESLEGKVILLYAGCSDMEFERKPSCAYGKLKEMKTENFEIIYVGCRTQMHYNVQNNSCHMAERMPWLRLSFSDMGLLQLVAFECK